MSHQQVTPPLSVAAYGKLPWAGDFLKVGQLASTPFLLEWLEQSVAVASARGDSWKKEFDQGPQTAFILPTPQALLVGVMAPSRDAVGRRFPFVIYAELPRDALNIAPYAAPLILGGFLEDAGSRILELAAGQAEPAAFVAGIAPPDLQQLSMQLEGYAGWAKSATVRAAGQAIFGADWRTGLAFSLYVALESIRPFHGQESPPTPLSVRLPLGAGYAGAAAFWLQVVRLAAGWQTTIPSAFWAFSEESPSVTVFFGQMPSTAYAELWERAPDGDSLSNLVGRAFPQQDFLSSVRPDLTALLQREEALVVDLLRQIGIAQVAA